MSGCRAIIIVIDACGVGELPDADQYGDVGSATLPNLARSVGGLRMPVGQRLGLGNIVPIEGILPADKPEACFGKMAEQSKGKDSTSGHWELAGVVLENAFPVFPNGFPAELVREFEKRAGVKAIGNVAASGTEIIATLGEEHIQTGRIILYTSADSVFQLAAHVNVIPTTRLYEICQVARDMLTGEFAVGRVIARPFDGQPGSFVRTSGRRDFSLEPPEETLLDLLANEGSKTLAIGKIHDLFAGRGVASRIKTTNNDEVMQAVMDAVSNDHVHTLIFANCVDFDEKWGHRNDETSFASGLERFDQKLGALLPLLRKNDLLVITADHGCDPTIKSSTDHSREYVPLLVYGGAIKAGVDLCTRETFADLGATLADWLGSAAPGSGSSFCDMISPDRVR